jgi:hypothetical protein
MTRSVRFLASAAVVSVCQLVFVCTVVTPATAATVPFTIANARFEQNATDADVEVVFEVKAGDGGLLKLTVVAPDGRTVVDFTAPDASTLGMRQFRFESPEPKAVEKLKAAYPEGMYVFTGSASDGRQFRSEAALSHALPPTASFRRPAAAAEGVATTNVTITFTTPKNLKAVTVEIEQEEQDVNLAARLPGSATQFSVPQGFLQPGTEYHFALGTVAANGNISIVETSFRTGGTGTP